MKVGDKIVCVDDTNQENNGLVRKADKPIVKDEIYEVKGFDDLGGIILNEFSGGVWWNGRECGWKLIRFRKVETQWVNELLAKIQEEQYANVIQ